MVSPLYPDFRNPETDWETMPVRSFLRLEKEEVGQRWADTQLLSLTKKGVIARDIDSGVGKYPASFEGYQYVEPGDLVFCLFDVEETPRTIGLVKNRGMITSAYTRARLDLSKIDSRYAEYLFLSLDDEKRFRPFYNGLRNTIQKETFRSTRLSIPSVEEQRRIAAFLGSETAKIDALIAKQEELVTTLDERRKAVISHATKASLSHQAENTDWRLAPLKSLVAAQTGGTPDSSNEDYWSQEGTPWVAIGDMSAVSTVTSTERKVSDLGLKQKKLKAGKPGTVLFAMYASVGATSMLGIEAVWNQAILGLTPKPESINNRFLQFSLEGNREMWKFWSNSNTQENLNQQSVLNAKIAVPSHEEQLRIVQFLEDFERKSNQLRSTAESVIQLLNERRQALISAAVTGKLEVGV